MINYSNYLKKQEENLTTLKQFRKLKEINNEIWKAIRSDVLKYNTTHISQVIEKTKSLMEIVRRHKNICKFKIKNRYISINRDEILKLAEEFYFKVYHHPLPTIQNVGSEE